jgi:hypothetical protein
MTEEKKKRGPRGPYTIRIGEVPNYRALSLGWGVQSWTIAAMAAIAKTGGCSCSHCQQWDVQGMAVLDFCIHADTTFERDDTYSFSRTWTPWLIERTLPVITVTNTSNPPEIAYRSGAHENSLYTIIPAYTIDKKQKRTMTKRGCTNNWKIQPVNHYLLNRLRAEGVAKRDRRIDMWLGISLDEWTRMKDGLKAWIVNTYPLIDRKMTRDDCKAWLRAHDLPVPVKSACVMCPYRKKKEWQDLRADYPIDWERAVAADTALRADGAHRYVHPSFFPLEHAVKPTTSYTQIGLELDFDMEETDESEDPTCDSGYCFT